MRGIRLCRGGDAAGRAWRAGCGACGGAAAFRRCRAGGADRGRGGDQWLEPRGDRVSLHATPGGRGPAMNIHEYQAKELLRQRGVAVLEGHVAWTPEEAEAAAAKLPGPIYVVKSQIHAGGRGAGRFADDPDGKGGVRLAKSAAEVKAAAAAMIGHTLVTKQTGPQGKVVSRVYVEDGCDIKQELYLGLLVDRDSSRVTLMASTEGGMEIEEVAEHHPEKILKVAVDPASGISGFHAR